MRVTVTHFKALSRRGVARAYSEHPTMKAALERIAKGSATFDIGKSRIKDECARHAHGTEMS